MRGLFQWPPWKHDFVDIWAVGFRAWRQHGKRAADKYIPSLNDGAVDEAFHSQYGFCVAEGPGQGLDFHGVLCSTPAVQNFGNVQAGKRSAAGAPARAKKNGEFFLSLQTR